MFSSEPSVGVSVGAVLVPAGLLAEARRDSLAGNFSGCIYLFKATNLVAGTGFQFGTGSAGSFFHFLCVRAAMRALKTSAWIPDCGPSIFSHSLDNLLFNCFDVACISRTIFTELLALSGRSNKCVCSYQSTCARDSDSAQPALGFIISFDEYHLGSLLANCFVEIGPGQSLFAERPVPPGCPSGEFYHFHNANIRDSEMAPSALNPIFFWTR